MELQSAVTPTPTKDVAAIFVEICCRLTHVDGMNGFGAGLGIIEVVNRAGFSGGYLG